MWKNYSTGLFTKTYSCKIYETPRFLKIFQKETSPLINQDAVILANLNIDHSDGRCEASSPNDSIRNPMCEKRRLFGKY